MNHVSLSIILPVFNAESYIKDSLREILNYLYSKEESVELIVIDDGSLDRTVDIIKQMLPPTKNFRCIINEKNRGKGYCVHKGMSMAEGEKIAYFDSDLAYPLKEIERLIVLVSPQNPIVIASRVLKGAVFEVPSEMYGYFYTRHIMSRLFNLLIRMFFIKNIRDTQSGLKVFSKEVAKVIFDKQTIMGFSFDVEILFIAQKKGYFVMEVPVVSKYSYEPSTLDFIADGLDALRSLARIKWNDFTGKYV